MSTGSAEEGALPLWLWSSRGQRTHLQSRYGSEPWFN